VRRDLDMNKLPGILGRSAKQLGAIPASKPAPKIHLHARESVSPLQNSSKAPLRTNNIALLDWPTRSPDLNPIENIWDIIGRRVYANFRQSQTLDDLKNAIETVRYGLEQDLLKNRLINNILRRIAQVLLHQGGPIDD